MTSESKLFSTFCGKASVRAGAEFAVKWKYLVPPVATGDTEHRERRRPHWPQAAASTAVVSSRVETRDSRLQTQHSTEPGGRTEEEVPAAADCTLCARTPRPARARSNRLSADSVVPTSSAPTAYELLAISHPTSQPATAVTLTLSFIHPLRAKTLRLPYPRRGTML